MNDPYARLKAPLATPLEEICSCSTHPPIKLMSALTPNPIHCLWCNLEVDPQKLNLSTKLIDEVANWNSLNDALLRLWLDSGAYEEWAKHELLNLESYINVSGRKVTQSLKVIWPCYYWIFQDQSDPNWRASTACPLCNGVLHLVQETKKVVYTLVCEQCLFAMTAEQ